MAEAKKIAAKKAPVKQAAVKKTGQVSVKTVTTKAPAKSAAKKAAPSHQQIAELAHKYWMERGGHHGSDAQDWLRAEKELRG
jgi:hypothetical protein